MVIGFLYQICWCAAWWFIIHLMGDWLHNGGQICTGGGGQINKRNTYVIILERPLIFFEKKLHFSLNSFEVDKV